MAKYFKKICAVFTALLMMIMIIPIELIHVETVLAVSADYPVVLLRISSFDNSRHLNISGCGFLPFRMQSFQIGKLGIYVKTAR